MIVHHGTGVRHEEAIMRDGLLEGNKPAGRQPLASGRRRESSSRRLRRSLRDLQRLADLGDRLALAEQPVALAQLADDLLGGVPALLHVIVPVSPMIVDAWNSHNHRTEPPGSGHSGGTVGA